MVPSATESYWICLCVHLVWFFGNQVTACFCHSPSLFVVRILIKTYLWEKGLIPTNLVWVTVIKYGST